MSLTPEQEALRARLGSGARYDAEAAPHDALLTARRGTAFFARKLNDLSDEELDGAALTAPTRRHVVGQVAYQARWFAERFDALRTGADPLPAMTNDEIAERIQWAVTLPDRALRGLFHHSTVHLNVVWRDLTDADWDKAITLHNGETVAMRETPLLREKTVWTSVQALDNGARPEHLPPEYRAG